MAKCDKVANILGRGEELDLMTMREFLKSDGTNWGEVLESLRDNLFVTRGMFEGDANALGDFFCLLDMALLTCIAEDGLEEQKRLTIEFIREVWPTTCAQHISAQVWLMFKTGKNTSVTHC